MQTNPLHSFCFCPKCGAEAFEDFAGRAKRCSRCSLTYFHNVASAVACLIRNSEGEYLFVRRAKAPAKGTLDLPGGFVDPLETVEQAVCREIKEETGLEVRQMRYLTSRPNVYPYSGIDIFTSDLFFLVEVDSFDGAEASDDAAALVISRLDAVDAKDFGLDSIQKFMAEFVAKPSDFVD